VLFRSLAGIKSAQAADTAGYDIIVVGGPVYAGALTASVKDQLSSMTVTSGTAVAVFGSGSGPSAPEDIVMIEQSMPTRADDALANAVVVKIGNGEDIAARAQDLVNQLTVYPDLGGYLLLLCVLFALGAPSP
jgi:hypothetical protein